MQVKFFSSNNTISKVVFFTFCCFFIFSGQLIAQKKYKQLIEDGDREFADKNYFSASIYYNNALLIDSSDIELQYKYADASRLNFDYNEAERMYNKVYKMDRQGKKFPECSFWLASIIKSKGKYKEAEKLYRSYAQKHKRDKNSYFYKKAEQEILACQYAQIIMASPDTAIHVQHLDSMVNSKVSEYAPIQIDSTLYFSSLRDSKDRDKKNKVNYNKLYTSIEKDTFNWYKAKELDTLFNRSGIHNANTAFNKDFTVIYITRCVQKNSLEFNCEILSSKFENGKWTDFTKLPASINQPNTNNTQPALGKIDGEDVLFFSSNRPGGVGGMDIWYSKITKDGSYGAPVNAGKKVNSLEDEITPFYCNSCNELFFSSTWHKGLGGFDIFKSEYKDKNFEEPKNLGIPVNSNYNDIYFSINSEGSDAFISSNRIGSYFEEKETCCNDIWKFKIPKTEEPLKDSVPVYITQLKQLVPLTLYFHNDEPDKKTLATTTKKSYDQTHKEYKALIGTYAKEFSKGLSGKDYDRAVNEIDALFEDSVDAGMEDLEKFAKLLVKVLDNNERVTITMKGYCSPLASTDYNVNLAKRRISSLKNYFLSYNNGYIAKFLDNADTTKGSVTFLEVEIGELKARPYVSDNFYDQRNSVYSPLAAFERKIQIIAFSNQKVMLKDQH